MSSDSWHNQRTRTPESNKTSPPPTARPNLTQHSRAPCQGGPRPVPRRQARRRQALPMQAAPPTGGHRQARHEAGPAVPGPPDPAQDPRHPHRPATLPARPAVRERRQRAAEGHVGRLPEDHRLLRRTRPAQGARHDATGSSTASTPDPPTRPASRGH